MIRITECPRDAMQGIKQLIPTQLKTAYINQLLKAGYDIVDFGSFVSPGAIPQMKDTAEVLAGIDLSGSRSKLLSIVANERGAIDACSHEEITFLGFPFSISETFQQRNTNSGIDESFRRLETIADLCRQHKKELLVYLSMAFGNPYGDEWSPEIAAQWAIRLASLGIKHLALADTVGSSEEKSITSLFTTLLPELKGVSVGAHLHSTPAKSAEKIMAAYKSGCRSFDVAIRGFGGCPMAKNELTGNIATENLLEFLESENIPHNINKDMFLEAVSFSSRIFDVYH